MYNSFDRRGWLDTLSPEFLEHIEFFMGDIRDPNGVRQAIQGVDAVLHLAALIAIPFSYHSPDSYVDTNIKGTLNVLQAARDLEVQRVVHTSTSEVYGSACYVPIDEKHPLQGQSPYSASKIGADQLALSFYRSFELPLVIARPFNTYGPRQSTRAVIPTIISQLAMNPNELRLGAISPTRDFNYVLDTVRGFEALLRADDQVLGEEINLGSGFEVSIEETVNMLCDLMGVSPKIVTEEQRLRPDKSEVNRLFCDNRKALKLLDWQPEFAGVDGFRKGLEHTVHWFQEAKNLQLYRFGDYTL